MFKNSGQVQEANSLASNISKIQLDTMVLNWAMDQFSGILHKANKFDKARWQLFKQNQYFQEK